MFGKLKNEAILTFDIVTQSPLYIREGTDNSLDPSAVDGKYMTTYKDGKLEPFIPGTSLKGAFRSRAERVLRNNGACDIINRHECIPNNKLKPRTGQERYKKSCPICRLFGSNVIKSRVSFGDAYVADEYKIGQRTCVAIDRITGSAKGSALYSFEYIEDATFKEKIALQNFETYQIKLLLYLIEEMNEGFLTLGGLTSKGFGCVKAENLELKIKQYGKEDLSSKNYEFKDYYNTKTVKGFDEISKLVSYVDFTKLKRDGDIDEQTI